MIELSEGDRGKVACPYSLPIDGDKVYININNEYGLFVNVE